MRIGQHHQGRTTAQPIAALAKAAIVILRMGGKQLRCSTVRHIVVCGGIWLEEIGNSMGLHDDPAQTCPLGWLASPLPEEAQATQHWPRILMSPKAFSRLQAWAGLQDLAQGAKRGNGCGTTRERVILADHTTMTRNTRAIYRT